MLLDPGTLRLAQRADEVLAVLSDDLAGRCSAETHEAALELVTGAHATVGDAIAELGRLRARLCTGRKRSPRTASWRRATAWRPSSSTRCALRVPVAKQLAEVLTAAGPHASLLGVADELARAPTLVVSPEAARQEAHATRAGIPSLVCDLASRFSHGDGRSATSLGPPAYSTEPVAGP